MRKTRRSASKARRAAGVQESDPQLARVVIVFSRSKKPTRTGTLESSSGLLVNGQRVLTTRHGIFEGDDGFGPCLVQTHERYIAGRTPLKAKVIWPSSPTDHEDPPDIVVLELDKPVELDPSYVLEFGSFGGSIGRTYDARAMGYPKAASTAEQLERGRKFVPFALFGRLDSATGGPDGLSISYFGASPTDRHRGWRGISGGPIFVTLPNTDRQVVVGMARLQPPGFGARDIVGIRWAHAFDTFAGLWSALGEPDLFQFSPSSSPASDWRARARELAEITIWALDRFEELPGEEVRELILDPDRLAQGPNAGIHQMDQASAFECLAQTAVEMVGRTIVLGGTSGVGKSSILRKVARKLATDFLESTAAGLSDSPAALPIVINIGRIGRIDPGDGRRELGASISRWWIGFANSMRAKYSNQPFPDIDSAVLRDLGSHSRLVGIIDSADVFLEHNPRLSEEDLLDWAIDCISQESHPSLPRFTTMVIASRNIPNMRGLLATKAHKYIEVGRLTEAAACEMFPRGLWDRLRQPLDEPAQDLLRTPFIATLFRVSANFRAQAIANVPRLEQLFGTQHTADPPANAPAGALIEFALRSYLWRDPTPKLREPDIDALIRRAADIAYLLMALGKKEETPRALEAAAQARRPNNMSEFTGETAILIKRGILHEVRDNLGRDVVGFSHGIWQNFLESYTIASEISRPDPDLSVLDHKGLYTNLQRDVSYLLIANNFTATEPFMRLAFHGDRQFRYGNIFAVLGHSIVNIDEPAIDAITSSLSTLATLPVHILLSSLGARVLVNDPRDSNICTLKDALASWCREVEQNTRYPLITRSLAQCIAAEVGRTAVGDGLDMKALVEGAYPFAHGEENSHQPTAEQRKSLEHGYVHVVARSFTDPPLRRLISAAHCAVMAAACYAQSRLRPETGIQLWPVLEQRQVLIGRAEKALQPTTAARISRLFDAAYATLLATGAFK